MMTYVSLITWSMKACKRLVLEADWQSTCQEEGHQLHAITLHTRFWYSWVQTETFPDIEELTWLKKAAGLKKAMDIVNIYQLVNWFYQQ